MDKKTAIAVIAALVVIIGGIAYALANQPAELQESTSINNGAQTSEETTIPESDQDVAVSGDNATITFTDSGFTPAEITVKKGTKVSVVNNSEKDVQFSSDEHPTHRDNPEMNLKTLAPGESASYSASIVGTHPYHDHIDDSQTGIITVTE